jgi:chromosome segregation ATPase
MGLINLNLYEGLGKSQYNELRRILMSLQTQIADLSTKVDQMEAEVSEVATELQNLREELTADNPDVQAISDRIQGQIGRLDALTPDETE